MEINIYQRNAIDIRVDVCKDTLQVIVSGKNDFDRRKQKRWLKWFLSRCTGEEAMTKWMLSDIIMALCFYCPFALPLLP